MLFISDLTPDPTHLGLSLQYLHIHADQSADTGESGGRRYSAFMRLIGIKARIYLLTGQRFNFSGIKAKNAMIKHLHAMHHIKNIYACNDCSAYFTEIGLNEHMKFNE